MPASVHRAHLRIASRTLRKRLHGRKQCGRSRVAQAHRLTQIAHHARAGHLGQGQSRSGQRDRVCERPIERVVGQIQVARRAVGPDGDAVDLEIGARGAGHHRFAGDGVAIAQIGGPSMTKMGNRISFFEKFVLSFFIVAPLLQRRHATSMPCIFFQSTCNSF